MSPSSGQQGGPPVRPAGGHFATSVHRCPRGHAGGEGVMPVAGAVGVSQFRLAVRGKLGLTRLAFLFLVPGLAEW